MLGKLPAIPKGLFVTDCTISILSDGLNEDGEQEVIASIASKCIFVEKRKQVMNAEKQIIQLEGKITLDGDIKPNTAVTSGKAVANGKTYSIYKCHKLKNPDGSIHHTELELI